MAWVNYTDQFLAPDLTLTDGWWVIPTYLAISTLTPDGSWTTGFRPPKIRFIVSSEHDLPAVGDNFALYDTVPDIISSGDWDIVVGENEVIFDITFASNDIGSLYVNNYDYFPNRKFKVFFGSPDVPYDLPLISLTAPTATATGLTVRTGCTLLSIVQAACGRLGLQKPSSVFNNSDATTLQMLGLLIEEINELSRKIQWRVLRNEASWITAHTETQGSLDVLIPKMAYIINETIWNRSLRRPIFGPMSSARYQQNKAYYQIGPWSQYTIIGGNIRFYPAPAAGQSIYLEYITTAIGTNYLGETVVDFSDDRDIPLLDCEAIRLGLIWRFRAAKGMEYAEDYAKYDRRVCDLIARDGTKPVLDMGGGQIDIYPGIMVPTGSWNV